MPYLSALEVCSRRGAIQIHVFLYLFTFIFISTKLATKIYHVSIWSLLEMFSRSEIKAVARGSLVCVYVFNLV